MRDESKSALRSRVRACSRAPICATAALAACTCRAPGTPQAAKCTALRRCAAPQALNAGGAALPDTLGSYPRTGHALISC